MTAGPFKTRQALVQLWIVQLLGTVVICGVVTVFARSGSIHMGTLGAEWTRYAMIALLASAGPALFYLRHYKRLLNYDARLERERGAPEPAARTVLAKSLAVGSALCEIPMALGVLQLLLGGETRWFLGATMITLALRLSYRPFTPRP